MKTLLIALIILFATSFAIAEEPKYNIDIQFSYSEIDGDKMLEIVEDILKRYGKSDGLKINIRHPGMDIEITHSTTIPYFQTTWTVTE